MIARPSIRRACIIAIALLSAMRALGANPSLKRGICAKNLSPDDFRVLAPGVSWWYNWSFEPDAAVPPGGPEFVPMLWGDSPELWNGLDRALRTLPRPRAILVINEPNLTSQADLAPEASASVWRRAKAISERQGIPLIGPQLAIGTPPKEMITAWDPIQKKVVPYTWMVPFWEAFRYFLPQDARPIVGIHPYGNIGELKWAVTEMARRTGQPVWVTEFNDWKAADEDAAIM